MMCQTGNGGRGMWATPIPARYTAEFKQRAVELYRERRSSPASRAATRAAYRTGSEGGRRGRRTPTGTPSRWPGGEFQPRRPRRENDRLRTENGRCFLKSRRLLRRPSAVGSAARRKSPEHRVRVHIGQRGLLEGLGLIRRPRDARSRRRREVELVCPS